ncbi:two component transcriptional regulator, AraC family [Pseudopedobacter saltans DSM 12145]|uniref:Two component transcriptional regulator, AraC family n=1 Tax=Pseudopedobacter saltans (strain ATCC 51119 / DSM 12145 / JCM 21818 / CCUG 39354 / LMG 10337 / NBRC 100064 / NCIMB 13643) TaxID=762903 RepID=F0SDG0_PSESL|nr:two-component regulator propeller domain-containing protein [Pseudopedobacter saltans]ADY53943.1 two component transcriptional regulator, AraC family [Pseudopedobacter saltans DSM 12145]
MKYKTIKPPLLLLILAGLLWPFCGRSQNVQLGGLKVALPHTTVTSIVQDSLGFMWLGTNRGISRFDGYAALPYERVIKDGIYINFVKREGNKLYIGSNNGLFSYDYIQNKSKICSEFLAGKNIVSYCSNDKYRIVATNNDIFLFDHSWKFINRLLMHKNILDNHIICMVTDKNKKIWVGTESGLSTISIEANGKMNIENLYRGNRIAKIFFDKYNNIWVCRAEEILYGNYHAVSKKGMAGMSHIAFNHEALSIFGYENQVWVGTRGLGISVFERKEDGTFIFKSKLLIDESRESDLKNTVFDIHEDNDNNVWICTLDGLFLYDGKDKRSFHTVKFSINKHNVPSSNIISSIYHDSKDVLWLATSNGINQLTWKNEQNYTFTPYMDLRNKNNLIANNKIQYLTKYRGDTLLVGTKNTIKFFDTKRKSFYDDKKLSDTLNTYGMRYVRSGFRDQQQNIWIAFSESVGVINTFNGDFTRVIFPPTITPHYRAIVRDAKGNLWISSDNDGLYSLELDKNFRIKNIHLYPKKQFGDTWITTIFIDQTNRMWVGTSNGLYRYKDDKGEFEKVEFPYSRKNVYIGGIIQDLLGNIWAVGLRGIYKINSNDTIYYYELNVAEDIVKTWYVLGKEVNQTGEIFIGGVNGLNFFNPTKLQFDTYQHKINISDVEVMNTRMLNNPQYESKEINSSGKIILSHRDNQFTLRFSSMYYKEPMMIEYAYMLEGYDKDWIITDASKHFASYSNLEAGNYIFKVKSTNASGIWLDNVKSIAITIKTSPWKSWWAYLIYASILIGITILIVRIYKLKFILRRREALNKWKIDYYTNLSYGFKVPLTLIYAPLQYLLKKYDQLHETEIKQMLYTMSESVSKLSDQVSYLVDFKKKSSGPSDLQLSKVDILPVINGIFTLFTDQMKAKHITYSFDSNIDSVTVYIDVTKIEIALYNILEDAISYTSNNGHIDIICILDSKDYKFKISIVAIGEKNIETNISNLNTRFSIAYDYIKLHHGELRISKKENDTVLSYTFGLSLGSSHYTQKEIKSLDNSKPVSLLPIGASLKPIVDHPYVSIKSLPLVYLIEGDQEIDLFIKNIFANRFDVHIISESEGIKPMLDKPPLLVICDMIKEEEGKFDICRQIKSHQFLSVIPVIFISSLTNTDVESRAYESGADIFMAKPFDIATLETRIDQLNETRAAIKEHLRKELIVNPKEVLITSDDDKFIVGVTEVIEDNISNVDFNVDILASKLYISRSTLYRKVWEICNMAPIDLIRNIRMKRAANLLELTDKPVSEVSELVGYSEQRYFCRCFKSQYGITPKKYAKNKKVGVHAV